RVFLFTVRSDLLYTLFPYTTLFRSNAVKGTFSEGFNITALPTVTAITLIASGTMIGKLNGDTHVTTPNGCFIENVLMSPPTLNRSEEHTSELQSRFDLVCRLLLEKK